MLAPWPSLAQACLAAGKASPSPAFGKLICTLQGPSPRSPPLGSLPKDLRPCLGLLSTPAGLTGGRGLPVQLRVVLFRGFGSDVPFCSSPPGTAGCQLPLGTSNVHSGPRRLLLVPFLSCRSGLQGSASVGRFPRPYCQSFCQSVLFSTPPLALYRIPTFSLGAALEEDAPSWNLSWSPYLSLQGP